MRIPFFALVGDFESSDINGTGAQSPNLNSLPHIEPWKVDGMKRWLTHLVITGYLGILGYGVVAHAVNYKVAAHPAMYFIVWDMFCGWSSHASRLQLVGETVGQDGEPGKFYELGPGPWGEVKPYGDIGRRHYDAFCLFAPKMAMNSLKHTKHEPMRRIYVVEECWPKKYNLPDRVFQRRHGEEKDQHIYYHVRYVLDGEGSVLKRQGFWLNYQNAVCISNNPRLIADSRKGRLFYNVSPLNKRASRSAFQEPRDAKKEGPAESWAGGKSAN
ncbi:MAG: hypothetical protein HON53_09345 [Planctomycetaceae bacterium]|nr:hypothetical protein [Planctomycetaceae bacterium]MBT6494355.1 hypothetical protein [Planctomycetaceae bacterium]